MTRTPRTHNACIRKQSARFAAAQASTPRHDDGPKWCEAWLWRSVVAHMVVGLLINAPVARRVLSDAADSKEIRGAFGTTWHFTDGSKICADETGDCVVASTRAVVL